MSTLRLSSLVSVLVALGACAPPADPSLTIEAAPSVLDYVRRASTLRIVATNADGTIGRGQVTLTVSPGELDADTLDLDEYGVARTTVGCPTTDAACVEGGSLKVTATWTPKAGPTTATSNLTIGKAPTVWTAGNCPPEALLIYLFTSSNELYTFHPPTKKITLVAPIQCAGAGNAPFSMAVSQSGVAWVSYGAGVVYPVNLRTGRCTPSGAITLPSGWTGFGMGFAADGATAVTEQLYLGGPSALAKLDVTTKAFSVVAPWNGVVSMGPELSATPDGELRGLFPPQGANPFTLTTVDKATATTTVLKSFSQLTSLTNYAFALWGADAWVFTGTTMTHYAPATGMVDTIPAPPNVVIVGAGVSRCGGQ
jgi:hypothetical protein